jgi:hypothetical protein
MKRGGIYPIIFCADWIGSIESLMKNALHGSDRIGTIEFLMTMHRIVWIGSIDRVSDDNALHGSDRIGSDRSIKLLMKNALPGSDWIDRLSF